MQTAIAVIPYKKKMKKLVLRLDNSGFNVVINIKIIQLPF